MTTHSTPHQSSTNVSPLLSRTKDGEHRTSSLASSQPAHDNDHRDDLSNSVNGFDNVENLENLDSVNSVGRDVSSSALRQHLQRGVLFWIGLSVVVFWVGLALLAPWIAPFDPLITLERFILPGASLQTGETVWLGTDHLGRDLLSRLIFGARTVVVWSSFSLVIAYAIGVTSGLTSAYWGGIIDQILVFFSNALISFPIILLYLLLIMYLGSSSFNILLVIAIINSPLVYRLVRSTALSLRNREYVLTAIVRGERAWYVQFVEILPNIVRSLSIDFCLRFGYVAITIGILGFLGVGIQPPTPDWGGMVQEGLPYASVFPRLVILPCVGISSMVLGMNLIAHSLESSNSQR